MGPAKNPLKARLVLAVRALCGHPGLPEPLAQAVGRAAMEVVGSPFPAEHPRARTGIHRCGDDLALCARWLGLIPEVVAAQGALAALSEPSVEARGRVAGCEVRGDSGLSRDLKHEAPAHQMGARA